MQEQVLEFQSHQMQQLIRLLQRPYEMGGAAYGA